MQIFIKIYINIYIAYINFSGANQSTNHLNILMTIRIYFELKHMVAILLWGPSLMNILL